MLYRVVGTKANRPLFRIYVNLARIWLCLMFAVGARVAQTVKNLPAMQETWV